MSSIIRTAQFSTEFSRGQMSVWDDGIIIVTVQRLHVTTGIWVDEVNLIADTGAGIDPLEFLAFCERTAIEIGGSVESVIGVI